MINQLNRRSKEALIRATVWAFIGTLYGMIFIFFYNFSEHFSLPLNPILVAGTLAGTIAALIYSSMSLAVIIASISSITCLIYVVSNDNRIDLPELIVISCIIGAIVGGIYANNAKKSRICRADTKTLTGASCGFTIAVLFWLLQMLIPSTPLALIVALSCLLTGSLYVILLPPIHDRFKKLIPTVACGAMVGSGTSIFISLLFFMMISGVTPEAAGQLDLFSEQVRSSFFQASVGGMLGGGIAGFISGMMLRKWQDM